MRIAYLECFSGISGDMFLGALLDAGVPPELFTRTVEALGVDARLEISRVDRSGISATKLDVIAAGEKELPREEFWQGAVSTEAVSTQHSAFSPATPSPVGHSHSQGQGHAHGHGHEHPHSHTPPGAAVPHEHGHGHSDDHADSHSQPPPGAAVPHEHGHAHTHRGLKEIRQI